MPYLRKKQEADEKLPCKIGPKGPVCSLTGFFCHETSTVFEATPYQLVYAEKVLVVMMMMSM